MEGKKPPRNHNNMYTNTQMLDKEISFQEFMEQFVTKEMKSIVLSRVGLDKLKRSKDEHLNDIPLKVWDSMVPSIQHEIAMDASNWRNFRHPTAQDSDGNNWNEKNPKRFLFSNSDGVCLAKAAARMILEENK